MAGGEEGFFMLSRIFSCLIFAIALSLTWQIAAHAAAILLASRAPQIVIIGGTAGIYASVASAESKKEPSRPRSSNTPPSSPNFEEPRPNNDGVAPNFEEGRTGSGDSGYGPNLDEGRGGNGGSLFKHGHEKWNSLSAGEKIAAAAILLGDTQIALPRMVKIQSHLEQLAALGIFTEIEIVQITEELKVIAASRGETQIDFSALEIQPRPADLIGIMAERNMCGRATARYLLLLAGVE